MDKRNELKPYLEDYLRQKGVNILKAFCCLNPAHDDKHPSMRCNRKNHTVHCFSCGVTYDIFDLIGIDYGLTYFPEQYRKVYEMFYGEVPLSQDDSGQKKKEKKELRSRRYSAEMAEKHGNSLVRDKETELRALMHRAMQSNEYFQSRGIGDELCQKYGLFEDDERAYMPLFEGGVCTGWCARAKSDAVKPRYKNSTGGMGVWNSDLFTTSFNTQSGESALSSSTNGEYIYITEGIINALTLEQMGCKAVALCGSQNVQKLLTLCEQNAAAVNRLRFVACGDNDRAGESMNRALLEGMKERGLSCTVLALGDGDGDINDLYLRDRERLRAYVQAVEGEHSRDIANYLADAAGASLDAFFAEGERRAKRKGISTGFDSLDDILDGGIYSGLYVIGAISSLGKTSFVLQVADYIAEHSADVLFFSLEQSRFELIAKSLSRTSALLDTKLRRCAFTARELLRGDQPANEMVQTLLETTKRTYAQAAHGMFLREGIADIGAQEIREAVREHIAMRGAAPVVVVDYLQILKPFDIRATDKQNTDRAVVELKRISRDFDVPVIAISSFNRDNYRSAVSMEAFKESGAVEYSSDVLFGMQLAGAGESGFDVNAAKGKEPRQVELVMLKNRNGIPYAKLKFDYYAKFSLFSEAGSARK